MAKKASTINLEEKTWDEINEFMKENKCNRNTAIEWMLIERRTLLNQRQFTNEPVKPETKITNIVEYRDHAEAETDYFLDDAIASLAEDMPE